MKQILTRSVFSGFLQRFLIQVIFLFPGRFQPPFRLSADVCHLIYCCFKGVEVLKCLYLLADADQEFAFLQIYPQFFQYRAFDEQIVGPDDEFHVHAGIVAQICAVCVFVIPGKILDNGFAINEVLKRIPAYLQMFVLCHITVWLLSKSEMR